MATAPDVPAPETGATASGDAGVEHRRAAEAVFLDALDQPGEVRARWVAEQCGEDDALRIEVLALLDAHERASGFLSRRPVPAPETGRHIGPWRVVRELGRGGMGVVYLAERDDGQFQRQVAIKLLRHSPDAEELQRRFGAERQILASLNHPNIAQLLDGGVSEGELPYLVMEFVDGVTITEHAKRERLTTEQRLELFCEACAAVEHAHRNLVIHRDLKPGNILVTLTGQVKLLDFGIAKLLDPAQGPHRLAETRTGLRVLTPEYASPEQVRGEPLGTASDVYSLGVLLYELLCGRRPYRLQTGEPQEVMHAVATQDPPAPSDRLLDQGDGLTADAIAAERGTTPDRLRRLLRRDLDAIPLMALRKETGDRYASVQELEADVRRYLKGEPLLAHRGSRAYRLRKFVGRRRLEVTAAAITVLSLLGGTGVAVRQARVASAQRDLAQAARERAELALRESREVTDFLVGMFDVYYPEAGRSASASVEELLRRGAQQAERATADPSLNARLLETMGRVHASVGNTRRARELLERSVQVAEAAGAQRSMAFVTSMYHLAEVLRREGAFAAADSISGRAVTLREQLPDPGSPDVADLLMQYAGLRVYFGDLVGADSLSARAFALRDTPGTSDSLLAGTIEGRASIVRRRGRIAETTALYERAIALRARGLGADHVTIIYPLLRLAETYADDDPTDARSEELIRRAIAVARGRLGEHHVQHANAVLSLAFLLYQRGDYVAAESTFRRAQAIQEVALGAGNPAALNTGLMLANVLAHQGRHADAERLHREMSTAFERRFGSPHPYLPGTLASRGEIRMLRGDLAGAERAYTELLRERTRLAGDTAAASGLAYGLLGTVYMRQDRLEKADSAFHGALRRLLPGVSENHPDIRRIYRDLATLYRRMGRVAEAERYRTLSESR
jgi:serine/threonine-protein kinase